MDPFYIGLFVLAVLAVFAAIGTVYENKRCERLKKNQEPKKPKAKRTLTVVYSEPKPFNVGKTYVELTFDDGKKFTTALYGEVSQYVNNGSDEEESTSYSYGKKLEEPKVHDTFVYDSLIKARNFLTHLHSEDGRYVDDTKETNSVRIGKVRSAKILKTVNSFEDFKVASTCLVEYKDILEGK